MIERFEKISMRGRVAYATLCLESALNAETEISVGWDIILRKLWSYTEINYLDDWQEIVLEILPSSILEIDKFDEEDLEYLSYSEFQVLKNLYDDGHVWIHDIIEDIYYIGTLELFGSIANGAIQSLKKLESLISKINTKSIDLPPIELVEQYSFIENNGWGLTFTREDIIPSN